MLDELAEKIEEVGEIFILLRDCGSSFRRGGGMLRGVVMVAW